MTTEELALILAKPPSEIISDLEKTSYTIPKWSDLVVQYDPLQHIIWNTTEYPEKLNANGRDDFKRTALGLQRLAVDRISQSMFSTPVTRQYNYDRDNEKQKKAIDIVEQIYKTDNYIDAENIERAKAKNASCQMATVWFSYEEENIVEDEPSKFRLGHTTYSEVDGYKLYPQTDPNGNIIVISIFYTDTSEVDHMIVYTNDEKPQVIIFDKLEDWAVRDGYPKPLEFFPVVYGWLKEPVWGGLAGTNLVEQLEEMESYQGLYIKRNALPTFTLDYGEIEDGQPADTDETSEDSRRIVRVGKGGGMEDVTWGGADEAITSRYNRIRNAFFEQIQVPDTSFANMIKSNTSAENKELIFADAKAKAKDLGGEWETLFYKEMQIILKFAAIMFPTYAEEYKTISVRSTINPYSIKTKMENAEYVMTGGQAMSLETQVRELGAVDDVASEVEAIEKEQGTQNNQLG